MSDCSRWFHRERSDKRAWDPATTRWMPCPLSCTTPGSRSTAPRPGPCSSPVMKNRNVPEFPDAPRSIGPHGSGHSDLAGIAAVTSPRVRHGPGQIKTDPLRYGQPGRFSRKNHDDPVFTAHTEPHRRFFRCPDPSEQVPSRSCVLAGWQINTNNVRRENSEKARSGFFPAPS